jgi:hypothetical protein
MSNIGTYFQAYGVMDFILPFILVFTITYAVMHKTNLLGNDKFHIVLALSMGLLFVIPHMTGSYPLGYDPVQILNESLPHISLVSVAVIMVMLLLGVFGQKFSAKFNPFIVIIALGFVIFIFGSSLELWNSPQQTFSWWSDELTELMIIILVFGVVIWFITKNPDDKINWKEKWKNVGEYIQPYDKKD